MISLLIKTNDDLHDFVTMVRAFSYFQPTWETEKERRAFIGTASAVETQAGIEVSDPNGIHEDLLEVIEERYVMFRSSGIES